MPLPSIAVIDIGSNSIKVLLATRAPDGRVLALTVRALEARISAGISQANPRLGEPGMERGIAAIRTLLAETAPYRPGTTVLVATSAVRDAANGAEFRERVRRATGLELRVLSGGEEANLIGRGLLCDPLLSHLRDFQVFDLGGGSLDMTTVKGGRTSDAVSLPFGPLRLLDSTRGDIEKARQQIDDSRADGKTTVIGADSDSHELSPAV